MMADRGGAESQSLENLLATDLCRQTVAQLRLLIPSPCWFVSFINKVSNSLYQGQVNYQGSEN